MPPRGPSSSGRFTVILERSEESPPAEVAPVADYYVCIMTNKSRTLYTGVTNDLSRRVYEHKHKLVSGFTARYNLT